MKCNICRKEYSPDCDHNQGRCPNHTPMIEIQPKDTSKGHFYVSLVKSFVRIGAGSVMILGAIFATDRFMDAIATAGAMIIFAEVLGIVEELV